MKRSAMVAGVVLSVLSVVVTAQDVSTFTDKRDGKTYKTVKIGSQVWMAENLNYDAKGSMCYGEGGRFKKCDRATFACVYFKLSDAEIQANCARFGRLYTWDAATTACPAGWHLPNNNEWKRLTDYARKRVKTPKEEREGWEELTLGDRFAVLGIYAYYVLWWLLHWQERMENKNNMDIYMEGLGIPLKSKTGWCCGDCGNDGTDDYGFKALPGGFRNFPASDFYGIGREAHWWSATKDKDYDKYAYYWRINFRDVWRSTNEKESMYSVRCVAD